MSARQLQALRLLAEGHDAREVAAIMGVSYFTARAYMRQIRAFLDARNIAHAVHEAWLRGILP